MNENLVKRIMDETPEPSPSSVNLRLVIEREPGTQTESKEITLSNAIKTALDLGLDLVEIDLNQEVPVVRAVKYEAKVYRATKEKAKTPKDPGSITKEFRFKAQTEEHDLQRKVKDIIEALEKGHKCTITARCRKRIAAQNPQAINEVFDRVLEQVKGIGEPTKTPEINNDNTQGSVLLISSKS